MDRINSKTIDCYFTVDELNYINQIIVRERYLTDFVRAHLEILRPLGVDLVKAEKPANINGKIASYIRRGTEP